MDPLRQSPNRARVVAVLLCGAGLIGCGGDESVLPIARSSAPDARTVGRSEQQRFLLTFDAKAIADHMGVEGRQQMVSAARDIAGQYRVTLKELIWPGKRKLVFVATGEQSSATEMAAEPGVAFEPDSPLELHATSSDPRFGQQWGMTAIDVGAAWDVSTANEDVVIAVIDTGINYDHEDLSQNIWVNEDEVPLNGIDDDQNGYVDDYYGYNAMSTELPAGNPADGGHPHDRHNGHGSHVAGVIAAPGDNGLGVSGVLWRAKLMAIKIFGLGSTTISDAIRGVRYALHMKRAGVNVRIVNASWGGSGFSQSLYDVIEELNDEGILYVASAGNAPVGDSGVNIDEPGTNYYPADYDLPNVLTVTATRQDGHLWSRAYFGHRTVELAAPGASILSTVAGPTSVSGLAYEYKSGTSMAVPHVSGAAALLLSRWPTLSLPMLRTILQVTSDTSDSLIGKATMPGQLNAGNAMNFPHPIAALEAVLDIYGGDLPIGATLRELTEVTSTIPGNRAFSVRVVLSLNSDGTVAAEETHTVFIDEPCEPAPIWADHDQDGDIDGRDFLLWQRGEGAPCAAL